MFRDKFLGIIREHQKGCLQDGEEGWAESRQEQTRERDLVFADFNRL